MSVPTEDIPLSPLGISACTAEAESNVPVLKSWAEVPVRPIVINASPQLVWEVIASQDIGDRCPFSRAAAAAIERNRAPRFAVFMSTNSKETERTAEPYEAVASKIEAGETVEFILAFEMSRSYPKKIFGQPPMPIPCFAKTIHRLRKIDVDGDTRTEYTLTEQVHSTELIWDGHLNPAMLEAGAQKFAKSIKAVCELKAS